MFFLSFIYRQPYNINNFHKYQVFINILFCIFSDSLNMNTSLIKIKDNWESQNLKSCSTYRKYYQVSKFPTSCHFPLLFRFSLFNWNHNIIIVIALPSIITVFIHLLSQNRTHAQMDYFDFFNEFMVCMIRIWWILKSHFVSQNILSFLYFAVRIITFTVCKILA